MDLATRSKAFTDKEAAILNHCRMYLNVTTLSDISTAKGDMLIPVVEWGGLDLMPSRTTGHMNHQKSTRNFLLDLLAKTAQSYLQPARQTLRTPRQLA
jgi:hypothetical protein